MNAKFAPISLSFVANWLRSSFVKAAIFEKSELSSQKYQKRVDENRRGLFALEWWC